MNGLGSRPHLCLVPVAELPKVTIKASPVSVTPGSISSFSSFSKASKATIRDYQSAWHQAVQSQGPLHSARVESQNNLDLTSTSRPRGMRWTLPVNPGSEATADRGETAQPEPDIPRAMQYHSLQECTSIQSQLKDWGN